MGAEASVGGDRRDPSRGLLASESAATYYSNVLDEGGHLFARLQWAGHVDLDAEREEMEQRARQGVRSQSNVHEDEGEGEGEDEDVHILLGQHSQ